MERTPVPDCLTDIVGRSEALLSNHCKAYAKKRVSTGLIPFETKPLQKSVFEGTFSDAIFNADDGSLAMTPDFDGDQCNVCNSNYDSNYVWKAGIKLISRNIIRFVSGMFIHLFILFLPCCFINYTGRTRDKEISVL